MKKQKRKKIIMRLIILSATIGMMLGIAVTVLAKSPVVTSYQQLSGAINETRAIIAAAGAILCGILAFLVRHRKI